MINDFKTAVSKQTGGSLASDNVMNLFKRTCDVPFAPVDKTNFSVQEIVKNYGSNYMISGGSMEDVNAFVQRIADNRVLDLYLKYLGLTLLTPATLVPIALIMGRQTFMQVVSDMKANAKAVQSGGKGFLNIDIPIIDDNIVGNGLKLAGLTALSVSPYTLVPLGVLMYIYSQFENELQQAAAPAALAGGRRRKQRGNGIATVLPPEYFGRTSCRLRRRQRGSGYPGNNLDTPALAEEVFGYGRQPVDNSGISRPYQQGGTRTPFENTVPPNMVQQAEKLWSGQEVPFPRGTNWINNEMQITSGALPSQSQYNPPYSQQFNRSLLSTDPLPNAMAGGRRNKRRRSTRRKLNGGSGSDWINTLYSRGPVNSSDMSAAQFAMFNGTSPMIPNSALAGAPLPSSQYYNYGSYENKLDYTPLFMENVVSQPVANSGIFTSNFN